MAQIPARTRSRRLVGLTLVWLVGTLGMIVFSQGVSFARYAATKQVADLIDDHAVLLAMCGTALFCCCLLLRSLNDRIEQLESRLGGQERAPIANAGRRTEEPQST